MIFPNIVFSHATLIHRLFRRKEYCKDGDLNLGFLANIAFTDEVLLPSLLQPSPLIRYAPIDGLQVVMDLQTSHYDVLDESGTLVWNALLDNAGDSERTIAALAARFPQHPEIVRTHVVSLIAACREKGYLVEGETWVEQTTTRQDSTRRFHSAAIPAGVRAWWAMVSVARSLRRRGFPETYRALGMDRANVDTRGTDTQTAAAAFLRAENFFWFPQAPRDCLPRSLALYAFLRQSGLAVVHRIGGRRFPRFVMHAWVEDHGAPVLDDSEKIADYQILASLPFS